MDTDKRSIKSNFLWNTFGAVFFLACQWLITVLVVRFSDGYTEAGILSLAMSITNVFTVIALFNVRNYQVSDTANTFSQSEYLAFRIVTVFAALLLCTITALIIGYEPYILACIIGYMILKLTESFADVFHGIVQRKWRLDIAGKSFLLRGALMIISFIIVFPLTGNLALAIFTMASTNLIALIAYDLPTTVRIENISLRSAVTWKKTISLVRICLPMVIYGLAINSMMPISKCILEAVRGTEILGYYSSVTTVSMLIQTFAMLVFTPLIGVFGEAYSRGDKRALARTLMKLLFMICAVTVAGFLLSFLLGASVMTAVFGNEIRPYVYLLYPTIIISALTSLAWLLGMVLVVMRSIRCLLLGSVLGFVTSTVLSALFAKSTLFSGINFALVLGFALIGTVYLVRFICYVKGK